MELLIVDDVAVLALFLGNVEGLVSFRKKSIYLFSVNGILAYSLGKRQPELAVILKGYLLVKGLEHVLERFPGGHSVDEYHELVSAEPSHKASRIHNGHK